MRNRPDDLSDHQTETEHFASLLKLRDAEIDRLEASLADERRAALAVRAELDRVKAAHAKLTDEQRQATVTARLKRLFGRKERPE